MEVIVSFVTGLIYPFFQDFQGFLNDLQDWELSLKDKDKKMKPQAPDKAKSVLF